MTIITCVLMFLFVNEVVLSAVCIEAGSSPRLIIIDDYWLLIIDEYWWFLFFFHYWTGGGGVEGVVEKNAVSFKGERKQTSNICAMWMKKWVFYKISPRATISPTSHLVHSALKAFEWWLISFIGDVRDSDTSAGDDDENNIFRYEVFYVRAMYATNRVVFLENLHSRHKFYTTASRDGRDKSQLYTSKIFSFLLNLKRIT